MSERTHFFQNIAAYYRPRSKGDNTFGSVCPSVRLSALKEKHDDT